VFDGVVQATERDICLSRVYCAYSMNLHENLKKCKFALGKTILFHNEHRGATLG
jgi:hypothetical protein